MQHSWLNVHRAERTSSWLAGAGHVLLAVSLGTVQLLAGCGARPVVVPSPPRPAAAPAGSGAAGAPALAASRQPDDLAACSPTAPTAQPGPPLAEAGALRRWIAARAETAARGLAELVRLPLVRRADDWGCDCPTHYLGSDTTTNISGVWLDVSAGPTGDLPDDEAGAGFLRIVDGIFTGEIAEEDFGGPEHPNQERLYGFRVLRSRATTWSPEDEQAVVLCRGEPARAETQRLEQSGGGR